jgi:predicted small lipoprotein YifL
MKRRRFLAAVGVGLSLAGCGSRGPTPDASTPTDSDPADADPESPATTDPAGTDPPEGFALGETTGDVNPHGLSVRNDGQDTRTVDLRITDADTNETLLNRSYTLGAEEAVSGKLRGPGTYEVRVAVPVVETEHQTTVAYFDTCNEYGTTAIVDADGSITSETISTLIACQGPTTTSDQSG